MVFLIIQEGNFGRNQSELVMTRNYSTSIGLSATLSLPLDGGLQERCKQAAETQIALQGQLLANKRLDFELPDLKIVANYCRKEFVFHPRSPYAKVCADVVVQNVNHYCSTHTFHLFLPLQFPKRVIPYPLLLSIFSHEDCGGIFLPRKAATFFITFFTTGFTAFNKRSARGFASSAEVVAVTATATVAVAIPGDGMF